MNLREVFESHGCDKAAHCYHEFYETLPAPARMLEVGVFRGASLRAWREWWPEGGELVGVDSFARGEPMPIPQACIIKADSRRPIDSIQLRAGFDLIIDDGSHKPRDQAATLRNLWPLLAPGGVYVIEDVLPIDLLGEDNLPEWFRHPSRRNDFTMVAFLELAKAIPGKVKRHDFRAKSGKPDSVLVEIRKP